MEFAAASSSAAEADGTLTVSLTLSTMADTDADIVVPVTVAGTSVAVDPDDYTASGTEVTFPAGSMDGATADVTLTLVDDALVEGDETVDLDLGMPTGGAELGAIIAHVATITDSDTASVSFESATPSVDETDGTNLVNVVLTATGPSGDATLASALTVDFSDAATGSATDGVDYVAPTAGTLTFDIGATNNDVQSIGVDTIADLESEMDETIDLALANPLAPLALGADATASVAILDDDALISGNGQGAFVLNQHDPSSLLNSTTAVGLTGFLDVEGLAFDAASGLLYFTADFPYDGLGVYDPTTQTVSYVGGYGIGSASVEALAYDPNTATLYGVDDSSNSLITIDPTNGLATIVGTAGALGSSSVEGLAFDPNANVLYGADDTSNELVTIDTTMGTLTVIGPLGTDGSNVESLAFDPATNTLYGVHDSGNGSLVTINTTTGAATIVGALPAPLVDVQGLAFDTVNSQLFAADNGGLEAIFTLDTAATTATFEMQTGVEEPNGAAHDPVSGVTYILAQFDDLLYSIDENTGVATLIGQLSDTTESFDNLAVDPAGPTLYAESGGDLFTIGATDATVTLVGDIFRAGTTTSVFAVGLAYDHINNVLWAVDSNELFTVNTTTTEATLIGSTTGATSLNSLAIDATNGVLYAINTSPVDTLVTLDPTTAVATVIGATGSEDIDGIAFDPVSGTVIASDDDRGVWVRLSTTTGLMSTLDAVGVNSDGLTLSLIHI